MASPTPTPTPPHYPITTPHKPHQNQNPPIPTSKSRLHAAAAASNTINIAAAHNSHNHTLTPDFRRSRTTKVISKRNPSSGSSSRHPSSPAAALFLTQFLQPNQSQLPHAHIPALSVPDDYCSILHSLSSPYKTLSFYQSSLPIMRGPKEKGKLLTAAIASLGKSARPDLARRLFDDAVSSGFGDTVFAHSALVSAYARNGLSSEALAVFALMKSRGLKPNVISYNAVIDACVKGPADVPRAIAFFREMLQRRLRPDSKTFNSLLAGCSRTGQLEYARVLFDQMVSMGVPRDIYTYNTFIDVVCKSGNMEVAKRTVADMLADDIRPNVVTFSTLIDGYTKLERFNEALELYTEMTALGVKLDRVGYNALLSLYVKTGRYKEIPWVCEEMEVMGVDKDTVTYNSLIHGYGKLGRLDVVSLLVRDMREKGIPASVLTYSTLIDVYSKAGQHGDAARVFAEFKESGLKADVVMYSSFVDTLAKNGYVESAVWLLDEMVRVGIEPNVVTYNTVIDGFGKSRALVGEEVSEVTGKEITGQLVAEDTGRGLEELFCIQRLFERMIQQGVRPNVVTFSAILNACSRCNSFQDTSLLLEKLRLFDNFTYGVAHGMLMGCPEVWTQARSLFDELRRMDPSTSSAFYNALTDMLWHFGQKRGAQRVVLEGVERQVWENAWSEFSLDLHLMSSGAAQAMVHAWLLNVHSIVFQGRELPAFLSILTGWGKHSKVAGASIIRHVIEALLKSIGAPFQIERFNIGRLVSPGAVIAAWMRESGTVNILLLRDMRNQLASPSSLLPQLQALQL